MSMVLHCADISHPAKQWDLHYRWTCQLLEEFFLQGDMEKKLGLPFSPLCDRNNTLIAESQIGRFFICVFKNIHILLHFLRMRTLTTNFIVPENCTLQYYIVCILYIILSKAILRNEITTL